MGPCARLPAAHQTASYMPTATATSARLPRRPAGRRPARLGFEPPWWGRGTGGPAKGGAGLTVDGQRVDLSDRDIDAGGHGLAEAAPGRSGVDRVKGHLAGMAGYVPGGELALAEGLADGLARRACRRAAPGCAGALAAGRRLSLALADRAAERRDVCRGAPGSSPRPRLGGPGGARRAGRVGA